jgi:hypothetical protein
VNAPTLVPCLTLWQPYASLIFTRPPAKQFETRGFRYPAYMEGGRLAIHSALRPLSQCGVSSGLDALCREIFGPEYARTLPRGVLLGTVRLGASAPVEEYRDDISDEDWLAGDWTDGRYCWPLFDQDALDPPRPMRGKQGWSKVAL